MPSDETKLKKLLTFSEDSNLAIFDEIQDLNENILHLTEVVKSLPRDEISVNNFPPVKDDTEGLNRNFEALEANLNALITAIKEKEQEKINVTLEIV